MFLTSEISNFYLWHLEDTVAMLPDLGAPEVQELLICLAQLVAPSSTRLAGIRHIASPRCLLGIQRCGKRLPAAHRAALSAITPWPRTQH